MGLGVGAGKEREMGACVSTQEGCVGGRLRSSKKKTRKKKKGTKRRVPSVLSDGSLDKFDTPDSVAAAPPDHCLPFSNPTFHGPPLSLPLLFPCCFALKIFFFFGMAVDLTSHLTGVVFFFFFLV